ncbi:MAG: hypothetical protein ACKORG_02750 [Actinomycetota bacterium]
MDASRLAPIDDPLALARQVADGEPSDPWPQVRDILDDARAGLPDTEFEAVVGATRRVIHPLMQGRPAEWPPAGPSDGGSLPAGAAAAMRDLRATLCLSARHGGPGSARALAMLGRRIDAHLDDLVTGQDI